MKNIVILGSGAGSNAENIVHYFKDHPSIRVASFVANKAEAGMVARAEKLGIPCKVFGRDAFYDTHSVVDFLQGIETDLVVLAGFLWLIPQELIKAFPNRIVNIHPALLPKFGGKGMYGSKVHQAVIEAGEEESGISIHLVNAHFDEGEILRQEKIKLDSAETAGSLEGRIRVLEHRFYPIVIEQLLARSSG